jgi:hypothetical protein
MMELRSGRKTYTLKVEIIKAILHASLILGEGCSNDENELHHLSHFYLGCLYCNTKDYRTAIDHLLQVIKSRHLLSQAIEMNIISDSRGSVNTVSGFVTLYNFVITSSLNQRKKNQRVNVLTADSCAFLLSIDCLLKKASLSKATPVLSLVQCYRRRLKRKQTLIVGEMIACYFAKTCVKSTAAVRRQLLYQRSVTHCYRMRLKTFDDVKLRHLSTHVAVEYLSEFRETMSNDYDHVVTIVTTDYEAMYAYKCGRFQQCLRLCEEIVAVLWDKMQNALSPVFDFPSSELIQLMDDVCLFFIDYVCLSDRADGMSYDVFQLSLYLMTECQLKLKLPQNVLIDSLRRMLKAFEFYKQRPLALANEWILTAVYRRTRRTLANFNTNTLTIIKTCHHGVGCI